MNGTLHRPVCDLLGCTYPVVLAGMGGVARSELVAAVTRAGGFGFLGMVREPVDLIRSEVEALRKSGVHRFGVNLIPAATPAGLLAAQIRTCIELAVPVVALFWDLPADLVRQLREAGIVVVAQVGSVPEAVAARQAGVHVVIAQGCEAGGHVRGQQLLADLLPEVVAAVDCPVLAAGGIADGRDAATLLALGAEGVVLGTALLATLESFAHDYHKERVVAASGEDTVVTDAFHINWPGGAKVRVLANSVTRGERGDPFTSPQTVIGDENGRPIPLFSTDSPLRSMSGDFEAMALYAGKGVGRINAVIPAGERLRQIVAGMDLQLRTTSVPRAALFEPASSACLADEMDDRYMGFASRDELVAELNELLEMERAGVSVCLYAARETDDPVCRSMMEDIQRDETRWCAALAQAVRTLEGQPSRKSDAFQVRAMAVADLKSRLDFLNRGQASVARRLRTLLPKVRDDAVHGMLSGMLLSHDHNIERISSHFLEGRSS